MAKEDYSYEKYLEAVELTKSGRFMEAEEIFRGFCNYKPDFNEAKISLAKILLSTPVNDKNLFLERQSEGLKIIEKILNSPHFSEKCKNEAKYLKARYLLINENYYEAYDLYDDLLSTSYNADANLNMGIIEFQLGDIYSAKEKIEKYKGNNIERSRLELARIASAEEDYSSAYKYLYKLSKSAMVEKVLIEQLYLEIKQGNFENADNILKKLKPSKFHSRMATYYNIKRFLEFKLGKNKNIQTDNYLLSQLVNYNPNKARGYSLRVLTSDKDSCLYKYISINDMLSIAQEVINESKPYKSELLDYYTVQYTNMNGPVEIGLKNGRPTDTLKIGCLPGTKQIVVMSTIESIYLMQLDLEEKHGTSRNRKK